MSDEYFDPYAISGEGVTSAEMNGGETLKKEGRCHLEVVTSKPELATKSQGGFPVSPYYIVTHIVLAHDDPSCVGNVQFQRVYIASKGGGPLSENAKKINIRLGLAYGIYDYAVINGKECVVEKGTLDTNLRSDLWGKIVGRHIKTKIVREEGQEIKDKDGNVKKDESGNVQRYEDKYVIQYGRAWHVNDPAVKDWPTDWKLVELAGLKDEKPPMGMKDKQAEPIVPSNASVKDVAANENFSDI